MPTEEAGQRDLMRIRVEHHQQGLRLPVKAAGQQLLGAYRRADAGRRQSDFGAGLKRA